MDTSTLVEARSCLIRRQLVAYRDPLYQVLALDCRKEAAVVDQGVSSIGQILQQLGGGAR